MLFFSFLATTVFTDLPLRHRLLLFLTSESIFPSLCPQPDPLNLIVESIKFLIVSIHHQHVPTWCERTNTRNASLLLSIP